MFPSETGQTPLDAKNFVHRVFVPALAKAQIKDFHWHDLRHSFASRLAMAKVDIRTVQELMGHQSLAMTRRYAHLSPAHKLDAVQRLGRGPTGTTTGTEVATSKKAAEVGGQVAELEPKKSEPSGTRTQDPLLKRPAERCPPRAAAIENQGLSSCAVLARPPRIALVAVTVAVRFATRKFTPSLRHLDHRACRKQRIAAPLQTRARADGVRSVRPEFRTP